MTNCGKKFLKNTPLTHILMNKNEYFNKKFGPRSSLQHFQARTSPNEFQLIITWALIDLPKPYVLFEKLIASSTTFSIL